MVLASNGSSLGGRFEREQVGRAVPAGGLTLFSMMQILRQSLKLLRFTQLFDNVNPFTEAVVGDWDLPDEVHFGA